MWLGDRIYFTSDRTGTLELFRYQLSDKTTTQVTRFGGFDVLFPSRGRGGVIFECGGALHVMDEGTEQLRQLDITLADDRPWLRPTWHDGSKAFGSFAPSPSGKRVLVEFRGDVFSVPEQHGQAQHLTRTPKRRERQPEWSPDGTHQSYLAEVGDDYELILRDPASGAERQLTRGTGAWILGYAWSPDSRRIVFTDKGNRLQVVDVASGTTTHLDSGSEAVPTSVEWSADSQWLSYVKLGRNGFHSVWLCEATERPAPLQVTSDEFDDASPTFDPDGRYLYFTSARSYRHDGFRFERQLFALLMRRDVANPLAPRDDTEPGPGASKPEKPSKKEKEPSKDAKPARWRIDREGLAERLVRLPGAAGDYGALSGVADGLLFAKGGGLHRYDVKKRKTESVLPGVTRYRLAHDRKQLLYRHGGALCRAKVAPGQKAGAEKIPTDGVRVRVVPQEEWAQMYADAWRIMRDWFYDPRMHAVDWPAMRAKYAPLLQHASHRSDLDFLLGELIGELNCGHTYVSPGESPRVPRVPVGLLGCEFAQAGKHYRIASIFAGENWDERTRSPLTEPGVDVREGDFVLAIDGRDLSAPQSPYALLENTVGRQVELLVNARPERTGARRVVVRPIASESGLRYLAWVARNRALVDKLSGGRIGYVHVPNTAIDGHRELFRGFRPLARVKQALIIDDRYNGGGWIPDRMAMALGQPVLNYWARRGSELGTTPGFAFEGPRAMLINGYSSSGGDAFPFYFRKLGLGKLIGKRTWG
ncbi:MAG: PDZ domain-containing protein, partial [Planctomycetes bacterium]|nr:PDZ domain-containing protein [Planctomycetota bacterium]